MSSTIFLSIASLCYILMIMIIFFSKKKINTIENRIFTKLIGLSFFSLISEILITFMPKDMNFLPFILTLKIFLIFGLSWVSVFMEYVFIVTRNKDTINFDYKKKYQTIYYLFCTMVIVLMLLILVLPIYFYNENGLKYSYGPSVNVLFITSGIYTTIMAISVLLNIKNIKRKGYLPIILLIFLLTLTALIQKLNPALLIANTAFAIITTLMYHTIENPDLKMVDELNRNRILIEQNNESKANLLFKISQDVREPVKKISELSHQLNTSQDINELHDLSKNIELESNQLSFVINKVLNISDMDMNHIHVIKSYYNIKHLYDEIVGVCKTKVHNSVEFRSHTSPIIPEYLNGDSVKLKQILSSILNISFQNTTEGFIEFNIDGLIKYDICRLMINIEDSSQGMDLDTINDILDSHDLTNEELTEADKLNVSLKLVKKLIDILGGSFIIKSELNKGTNYTVILDQSILKKNLFSTGDYTNALYGKKRILIVDDNSTVLNSLSKYFLQRDYDTVTCISGASCIDRIKNKEHFDFILIDNEMKPDNAIMIFNTLKTIPDFSSQVIIMLEKNMDFMKNHYVEDCHFTDYILKDNLENELERIKRKYL